MNGKPEPLTEFELFERRLNEAAAMIEQVKNANSPVTVAQSLLALSHQLDAFGRLWLAQQRGTGRAHD